MKIYHDQYFTSNDFMKFSGEIFDERFKHFKDLTKLATNNDLSTVDQRSIKNEEKREKLKFFDLSFFLNKTFLGGNILQNMFVYQPTFSMLDVNKQMINIMFLLGNQKEYIMLYSN